MCIRDSKKTICKIADYVPNSLIPEVDGCGDYIRLRINEDDMINWFEEPDFFDFMEDSEVVEKIDVHIKEEIYTVYPVSYTHLLCKSTGFSIVCLGPQESILGP